MTAEHRFRDEWLIRVIQHLPGVTPERIAQWRAAGRPYLSQAVMEAGIAGFDKLAAEVQRTFHIGSVELKGPPDKATLSLVPEKIIRKHQVLPVRVESRRLNLAMLNPLDDEAILVVVSDSDRRDAIVDSIQATGSAVHSAGDGAAALAVAARERPDLIITDLELSGLDGLQVIRTAATVLALDAASLLMIPASRESEQESILAQGATDVLILPALADEVRDRAPCRAAAQARLVRRCRYYASSCSSK